MRSGLAAFARFADRIGTAALVLASGLVLLLVLVTTEQVIARYVIGRGSIAMQELQWHLFGAIFLLAAAGTLRANEHVRVDIVYGRLSPKARAAIDALGTLLFLVPTCLVMLWYGSAFVAQARGYGHAPADGLLGALLAGEASPDPGGLGARWIIKAMIPLGAGLLLLQGLAQLARAVGVLLGEDEPA